MLKFELYCCYKFWIVIAGTGGHTLPLQGLMYICIVWVTAPDRLHVSLIRLDNQSIIDNLCVNLFS